jgi:thioredoxin-related protein
MKRILILVSICFVYWLCNTNNRPRPVYDENSLQLLLQRMNPEQKYVLLGLLDSILKDASRDSVVFIQTTTFLQKVVSNPNSKFHNDIFYSKLLEAQITSPFYNLNEKQSAAIRLKLLHQNEVGFTANDFTFIMPTGQKKRLFEVQAKFLLLYFNNPECSACKEFKMSLVASSLIQKEIEKGKLVILSIYPDKDEKKWIQHLPSYPKKWIQGRDENEFLFQHKVYDLKAIPAVYLLDENKKVLLKDYFSINQLEEMLVENGVNNM